MDRSLIAIVALAATTVLAACDDPQSEQPETLDTPMEEPLVLPPEPLPTTPFVTDTQPAPDPGLNPAEPKSSEESVQPGSETLFY